MNNASVNNRYSEKKYNLYKSRTIIYSVFFAIALFICIFLSFKVIKKESIAPVGYKDSGTIDYRVYLKENDSYTEKFLPKGKSYIASLIDYIDINYNYVFNIDDMANINFEYKIVGDLIIENNSNNKTNELLNKSYIIKDVQTKSMNNSQELAINEKFHINYEVYNQFANKFRSSYGIDVNSYLKVYLQVKKSTNSNSKYELNEETNINEIIIPLSEKTIEININSKNNELRKQISGKEENKVNYVAIIVIVLLIIVLIIFLKIILKSIKKMKRKRSIYDKHVNKILKEYDRLIVETKNIINFDKCNIIKVKEFTELLDVRDNLKVPINYYCIQKHISGVFYIKSDNDIYALYLDTEFLEKDE